MNFKCDLYFTLTVVFDNPIVKLVNVETVLSFYEYCCLLQIEELLLPDNLRLTELAGKSNAELVLSADDVYAQSMRQRFRF